MTRTSTEHDAAAHGTRTRTRNQRTLAGYEACAQSYADETAPAPGDAIAPALQRFAEVLPAHAHVLEIGSGPGWDADALESLGLRVHRTDAATSFCALQARRGHQVDTLDLLTGAIATPASGVYDGAMMLYVIQHFERAQAGDALRKLADALTVDGRLLLSHPLGSGEMIDRGESGEYLVVYWSEQDMDTLLARIGFDVEWSQARDYENGRWRTVLARRRA